MATLQSNISGFLDVGHASPPRTERLIFSIRPNLFDVNVTTYHFLSFHAKKKNVRILGINFWGSHELAWNPLCSFFSGKRSQFNGLSQQDAHELVTYMVERLNKETYKYVLDTKTKW